MTNGLTVVTGPTGQVGMHLVDALVSRGRRVRAMVLDGDEGLRTRAHEIEIVRGDVRSLDSLRAAFESADVVYHLAAIVSTADAPGPLLAQVNIEGAANAARAAREAGVRRFIHFSSIVVFDPEPRAAPLDETRARLVGPAASAYTRSKIAGEDAVLAEVERGLDALIVHPTVVIGPYETHHRGIVQNLLAKQMDGLLPALVSGGLNAVDVRDVVDGALLAEEKGRTGERYILGGRWYSLPEFSRLAAEAGLGPSPALHMPLSVARALLPASSLLSRALKMAPLFTTEDIRQLDGNRDIRTEKAERELGYRPRPINEALTRCRDWLGTSRSS